MSKIGTSTSNGCPVCEGLGWVDCARCNGEGCGTFDLDQGCDGGRAPCPVCGTEENTMGRGLRKAALAALATRGPWSTTGPDGRSTLLHAGQVVDLYKALARPGGAEGWCSVHGFGTRSGRPFDRAITLLKRAGLVRYNRTTRTWVRTGDEP